MLTFTTLVIFDQMSLVFWKNYHLMLPVHSDTNQTDWR